MAARSLISRLYPFVSLPHSSLIAASRSSSSLTRLRPLAAAAAAAADAIVGRLISSPAISGGIRSLSTRPTVSSLNDPSPNFSNRPPKETILLEGCDFEHWLVVVDPPEPHLTRDEIIDSYIKTLAQVVGSEEEARMKIYSVSTKHYFAFGALVPEEVSYKIKELPKVRWVLPDSYLDVRNKDYGGEPFINGQAVPYDPKYHEEWVRNNARANERSRRNDRPRNSDRSRNFERRRENMQQNQNFPRDAPPPMPNDNFQRNPNMPPPQNAGPPNPNFNAPPMQNETYPRNPSPPPPQNARPPSPDYNAPPPIRNVPPPPPLPPSNQGYPGQMPSPSYPGGNQGYPGAPPQYQGPNQGYQGGNPGGAIPGSPNYHGSNPGYQGSSGSAYQGGYQGGNFGNTGYQGGYQGGKPSSYQPGGYQGVPTSAPAYEGRDVQGRDS